MRIIFPDNMPDHLVRYSYQFARQCVANSTKQRIFYGPFFKDQMGKEWHLSARKNKRSITIWLGEVK